MGPASQQILTAEPGSVCYPDDAMMRYTNVSQENISQLDLPNYDIRSMAGVTVSYLVSLGYNLAVQNWTVPTYFNCPVEAANCTFSDIEIVHNEANCQPGDYNTTMFVDPDAPDTTTTAAGKFNRLIDSIYYESPRLPLMFYDGSMLHRTSYDIYNYTGGQTNMTYDPANLQYVGNQTFVVLKSKGTVDVRRLQSDDIEVSVCTLSSYLNRTHFTISGRDWWETVSETIPINIDYNKLINTSYWVSGSSTREDLVMLNAYAIQMTLARTLVTMPTSQLQDNIISKWVTNNGRTGSLQYLLSDLFKKADQTLMLGRPEALAPVSGTACYQIPMSYHLNPAAYYTLCLVLLIPLAWWVFVWVLALRRADGVSRGNSQVALLVTGLTKAARKRFKGYSHADQAAIFKRANKVDIVFGETQSRSHRRGHVAFGLPDELAPIRQRRRSLPRV